MPTNRWHTQVPKDFAALGVELRRLDQVLGDAVVYDDAPSVSAGGSWSLSALRVVGSLSADGALFVSGAATLDATLTVSGDTTLKGLLSVGGAVTFSSNLTVGGTLSVSGTGTFKGALSVSATAAFGVHLSADAATGFTYLPTCSGAPSGTPVSVTGTAPLIIDRLNNKLYFYSGGAWRDAGP